MQDIASTIIPILEKYGIEKAALFGSYARGDHDDESDIDILFDPPCGMSLLDAAAIKLDLEDRLKKHVDLVTFRSLHPLLKDRILKDAHIFYEKRTQGQ